MYILINAIRTAENNKSKCIEEAISIAVNHAAEGIKACSRQQTEQFHPLVNPSPRKAMRK
jgi:hypothetical protein